MTQPAVRGAPPSDRAGARVSVRPRVRETGLTAASAGEAVGLEELRGHVGGFLVVGEREAVVGDPADPRTEVGPLINERQYRAVLAAIEQAREDGGRLLAGGDPPGRPGWFVAPTLFEDVDDDAPLARQETFGPVTALFRFSTLDEALARANAAEYGLSAAIFTSSLASARRFTDEAEAGVIHINSPTTGAEVYVPFGGIKGSGWGPHEQGRAALDFYTESVTVYEDC